MRNVILNTSNIVAGSNNTKMRYTFPTTVEFQNYEMALVNTQLAISWKNINVFYNDNKFDYIWHDAGGATTYSVTITSGFYNISQLNQFLQGVLISNGHYLVDDLGNVVYYLQFQYNSVYQAFEIRSLPIPTALPLGWSNPAGITFPAVASTPQLVILNTPFQQYTGLDPGTYPIAPIAVPYNFLSQNVPDIEPVNNMLVLCSLVNNKYQYPNNLLYTFVPEGTSGQPVRGEPYQYIWTDVQDGYYDGFDIEFRNENFETIAIKDPDIFLQLVFKPKTEVLYKT